MTKNKKKKYYERFVVNQKLENYEKLFLSLESIIFIILTFYSGFEFCRSENILWFALFIGILIGKFQWKKIKQVTKKMVIGR